MPAVGDVEMAGKPSGRPPHRFGRRRQSYRLPAMVALCFLCMFGFFVAFGGGPPRQPATTMVGAGSSSSSSGGGGASSSTSPGVAQQQPQQQQERQGAPKVYGYRVVAEFPHDPAAFTQGLQYELRCPGASEAASASGEGCREVLWESTGLNGRSTVREVDLNSGEVLRSVALPRSDFGEGLTRHGDRLYQLTWQSPRMWSYHVDKFEERQELTTPLADGWGVTSDGAHLIVGDSSEHLAWLDPGNGLKAVRTVAVKDGEQRVPWLNELEWVDGLIYANIWQTECIAQIDPATGAVVGWALLQGLKQRMQAAAGAAAAQSDVLNGIAWDERQRRLFVSGKLWARVYQVELVELSGKAAAQGLQQARQQCIIQNPGVMGLL